MGTCLMYRIVLTGRAKRFIDRLPKADRQRLSDAIGRLPDAGDIKKLRGHDVLYRLRVGDYRVIYTVDHGVLTVYVVDIGNRRNIYERY